VPIERLENGRITSVEKGGEGDGLGVEANKRMCADEIMGMIGAQGKETEPLMVMPPTSIPRRRIR